HKDETYPTLKDFLNLVENQLNKKNFKLPDESMVVLRVPRKHNLYTINLNNLCPRGNLACLVAHASVDESVKWHRRTGHVNYKNMNKLANGNLVRGLPTKLFKNDHTYAACYKDVKDEGIFDSGCFRSMTGNKERLDDFQEFQGGKMTFGGGEGNGKGLFCLPAGTGANTFGLPVGTG
nr:ribonuclease H-like domain-containing protein [Tanacetum cinerariifolium]